MRLIEFVHSIKSRVSWPKGFYSSLANVTCFSFGDTYAIRMDNGEFMEIPDLETILDIMSSEFHSSQKFNPQITIPMYGRLYASAKKVSSLGSGVALKSAPLVVTPIERIFTVPDGPLKLDTVPVDILADKVRQAVTMFNLTGEWTSFDKGNL